MKKQSKKWNIPKGLETEDQTLGKFVQGTNRQ